jgi:hypothetical protein
MNNQSPDNESMQHRIFRTDTKLSSHEINDLLGIRVTVKELSEQKSQSGVLLEHTSKMFKFALVTLALASLALLGSMYQLKIGPFFEEEVYASTNY